MSDLRLSAVIPAYNEGECLHVTVKRVHEILRETGEPFEIVLVDDGSADRTWAEMERCCEEFPEVIACRLSRNFGKENAICAGLAETRGDGVFLLDADLQHPPELIPQMLEHWRAGFDVVEAVKRQRGSESGMARFFANLFYKLLGSMTRFDFEGASDFKLMDRKVVNAWREMGERNVFFRGMAAWVGFNRKTIEFDVAERAAGESKWSRWGLLGLALKAITSFSVVPLRLISITGVLFLAFAILLGANTIYQYATGQAVTGFSTVILLLLIVSSLVMLALGIIGEYIARIYEEVKQRPRYLISERCSR